MKPRLNGIGEWNTRSRFFVVTVVACVSHCDLFDRLTFAVERWTSRAPFSFRIETWFGDKWLAICNGDTSVKVGRPYRNRVEVSLHRRCLLFLHDLRIAARYGSADRRDEFRRSETYDCDSRAGCTADGTDADRSENVPLLQLEIETEGSLAPRKLTGFEFLFPSGSDFLREVRFQNRSLKAGLDARFKIDIDLLPGSNIFPLTGELSPDGRLDKSVAAICASIQLDGKETVKLDTDKSNVR